MQTRPLPLWLMIVSMAIAVLPVWRSPMISSRCPRPIGISASMALIPVWTGVSTDFRTMTPGAMRSTGRVHDTTDEALSDGHFHDPARRLDRVALLDESGVTEDDRTDGLLLQVQGHAHDSVGEL